MNIGKATAIFKDIHNEETEVEDKITAIQEVMICLHITASQRRVCWRYFTG